MSAESKAWIAAEQKRGMRAAAGPVALGVLQVLAAIAQIFFAAHLLAAVLLPHARHWGQIAADILGYAVFALARAAFQHRAALAGFESGAAARRRLRNNILLSLFAIGPAQSGLKASHSGELASLAVDRVEAMEGFHARWIPATVLAVLGPALTGLAVFRTDWPSGIILTIAGLFVPFAMAVAGIGAAVAARRQFLAMTRLQIRFLDRIRGISTIVLAGRAADEAGALAAAADELRSRTIRVLRVAFLSSTALDLAAAAALVLIVIHFAGMLRHHPYATACPALFVLLLVPEFFAPLRNFAAVYQDRMSAEAVAEDLSALPEPPPPAAALEIRNVTAHGITLGFEDVTFAWDSSRGNVLESLSFRILAGDTMLLTGASGAGKSTIIDLILGFIEPASGKITFNGAELKSLVPAAREKLVGWIGQKPMIFNGTILENIIFAKPEAGADEINDAVKRARLTEVIAALPLGLETPIGEAGFGLSGGQAQRIAIARAFLKDAPLLLLDEPTAHLDPAIERDVLDSIKRLAIGRTVLLATHSTLAQEVARDAGARKLDLDAIRYARMRGVA